MNGGALVGPIDDGMIAVMPFGILRVDVGETWRLIADLTNSQRQRAPRDCDQKTICAIANASLIIGFNPAARELIGASDETSGPIGPVAAVLVGESQKAFVDRLFQILEGARDTSFEATLKHSAGGEVHVVVSLWPSAGDTPPCEIYLGLTNITQRVNNEEAKESLRSGFAHAARISMLGEMTASIAHEINQPLSSIMTNAEAGLRWLHRDEPDLVEVTEILDRVVRNAKRAANIITTMRAMARNTKAERRSGAINALVEEAGLILRSELSRRQVGLRLELAADLPEVLMDRTQILQVIVNLALNSAQAMAEGHAWNRTLAIRSRREQEPFVSVEVEDSGPGVDPEVRDKLFDSFYTTKETGTGLGLAICRSIIAAHDSTIELHSSPHLGARFSFRLPLCPAGAKE